MSAVCQQICTFTIFGIVHTHGDHVLHDVFCQYCWIGGRFPRCRKVPRECLRVALERTSYSGRVLAILRRPLLREHRARVIVDYISPAANFFLRLFACVDLAHNIDWDMCIRQSSHLRVGRGGEDG